MTIASYPIHAYVHDGSVRDGKVAAGAVVFIKTKELPADPQWNCLIVYEYLGPEHAEHPVLALVPLQRGENRTKATIGPAALKRVRTALVHVKVDARGRPPRDQDSTTLGNGNGYTPVSVP